MDDPAVETFLQASIYYQWHSVLQALALLYYRSCCIVQLSLKQYRGISCFQLMEWMKKNIARKSQGLETQFRKLAIPSSVPTMVERKLATPTEYILWLDWNFSCWLNAFFIVSCRPMVLDTVRRSGVCFSTFHEMLTTIITFADIT